MALIAFLISAASHTVNRKLALLQCMQQITRLSIKAAALSRVYLCANQQLRGSGLLTIYLPCWAGLSSEVDPTAHGQSKATCDLVNTARGVRAARACHPASPCQRLAPNFNAATWSTISLRIGNLQCPVPLCPSTALEHCWCSK